MSELLETIKLIKLGADWSDFALKKIDDVENAVKALEIIIEKKVVIWALAEADKCSQYNVFVALTISEFKEKIGVEYLTEEEFDTVKEVLADDRKGIL